jgi:hypothetical protein
VGLERKKGRQVEGYRVDFNLWAVKEYFLFQREEQYLFLKNYSRDSSEEQCVES